MTEVIKIERNGVKAEVVDRYLSDFIEDGWVKFSEKQPGDKFSKTELIELVDSSDSKEEIEVLIKDSLGFDIDKRGSLETIKEKALAVINESGRSNS